MLKIFGTRKYEHTQDVCQNKATHVFALMSKNLNNPVKNDNISGILKYKLYLTSPRLDWPNFLATLIIGRGQILTNQRPRMQYSANQRAATAP